MGELIRRNPDILIVGAGAIGQTYGFHLSRGGARVTYLVKEKYREETARGFMLYRHRLFGAPRAAHWSDFGVLSLQDIEAVGQMRWDQVWLCVSSTALDGDWLPELCAQIGEATLVFLQPGLEDFGRLSQVYDPQKIVSGLITLIAYQAPLAGEQLRPGVAFFVPPMTPTPFSEPASTLHNALQQRAKKVVDALDAGGLPARVDSRTPQLAALGAATLIPTIAGLEAAGWHLKAFRKSPLLPLSSQAAREAQTIAARKTDTRPPLPIRLIRRSALLGTGLGLAPRLLPFDLETYLRYHFTKVAPQTRSALDTYLRLGEFYQEPTAALKTLRALIFTGPERSGPGA